LKNTQRRRDFKDGVAFGVARNFCLGLTLTLVTSLRGKCPRHSKSRGKRPGGENVRGGNVRGWQGQGGECPATGMPQNFALAST